MSVLNIPGAKDPDEYIKKYGRERFETLLNGTRNAIEYKLARIKEKHDVASPAGRLDYIKEAIGLLAGRVTPTERDVYAGRLAEETNVSKAAILAQLDGAIAQARRRASRQRQEALMHQGVAYQIKVPYTMGGSEALGVANAEQQLVCALLKRPELIARVKALTVKSQSEPVAVIYHELGLYTFYPSTQTLQIGGEEIELSFRESELLRLLCESGTLPVDTKDILLQLWGNDSFYNTRSLHVFITKLRHKLEKDPRIKILNVRGIGYKLVGGRL